LLNQHVPDGNRRVHEARLLAGVRAKHSANGKNRAKIRPRPKLAPRMLTINQKLKSENGRFTQQMVLETQRHTISWISAFAS
jgi:hypothetical protein